MSLINQELIKATAFTQPYTSAIGKEAPAANPVNCSVKCPYGHDRAFCFPCYKKIMEEHRAAKKKA